MLMVTMVNQVESWIAQELLASGNDIHSLSHKAQRILRRNMWERRVKGAYFCFISQKPATPLMILTAQKLNMRKGPTGELASIEELRLHFFGNGKTLLDVAAIMQKRLDTNQKFA